MEDKTGRLWWTASHFYQPPQDHPYAVILLNEAVDHNTVNFFTHLWQKATVRVCVDGATNTYHQLTGDSGNIVGNSPLLESSLAHLALDGKDLPPPDIISGDFDSVHPGLLEHYRECGVNIIPTPDQDETDFTKAVKELGKYILKRKIQLKHVIVIAAVNNERFDHVIANLSTLYKVGSLLPVPVVIASGGSIFWLLSEGDHTIRVTQEVVLNSRRSWCGLVPFGYPATVTTTGLKWNLDKQVLGFGHVVSTSNTYDPTQDGQVTVSTCQPLVWTMGWDIDKLYPVGRCETSSGAQNSCGKIKPEATSMPSVSNDANYSAGNKVYHL